MFLGLGGRYFAQGRCNAPGSQYAYRGASTSLLLATPRHFFFGRYGLCPYACRALATSLVARYAAPFFGFGRYGLCPYACRAPTTSLVARYAAPHPDSTSRWTPFVLASDSHNQGSQKTLTSKTLPMSGTPSIPLEYAAGFCINKYKLSSLN